MDWLEQKDEFVKLFKPNNNSLNFKEISDRLNGKIGDDINLTKIRDELMQDDFLFLDNLSNTYKLTPKGLNHIGFVKECKDKRLKKTVKIISFIVFVVGGLVVSILQIFF